MATVGVLCARGRVEEKALMAALADAGIVSALFPPAYEPLPVGPLPVTPDGHDFPVPQIVVDRHPNRQIARAVLTTCRAMGLPVLSAGIAATGDRLDVASALAAHGLPRPMTALCTSEEAALAAVTAATLPATLLPLDLQATAIPLLDLDTAEAVLEHRAVLGGTERSLGLIQAGAPLNGDRTMVIVIDGVAVALDGQSGSDVSGDVLRLAEAAARALCADFIAVEIFTGAGEPIVWDARPVPEFRDAVSLTQSTVAQSIAQAVEARLRAVSVPGLAENSSAWIAITREGIRGDVVVSA